LNDENRNQFRSALVNHLIKFEQSKPIRRQLALGFATLLIQMSSRVKIDVGALTSQFDGHVVLLLDVLSYLAEEVENTRISLTPQERTNATNQLKASAEFVLRFLTVFTQAQFQSPEIQSGCLKCLGSWLSIGTIEPSYLASYPYFNVAFQSLQNKDSMFEDSVDVICQLIRQTGRGGGGGGGEVG
jgi:hypothetical protein